MANYTAFGWVSSKTGVGSACRGNVEVLDSLFGSHESIDFPDQLRQPQTENVYIHLNPWPNVLKRVQASKVDLKKHRVALYCIGEVEKLQDSWKQAVDDWEPEVVLTGSNFFKDCLAANGIQSEVVPHVVKPFGATRVVDEDFTFMFSYDSRSRVGRKNPFQVVEAFKRLKCQVERPVKLIIKTSYAKHSEHRALNLAARGDNDISILNCYLSPQKYHEIYSSVDCFVSAHRSEGFGLHMAEAMLSGIPTIATRFGGNLDYMNDQNSWLIDQTLEPVDDKFFPVGSEWGQPSLDHLVELMKEVYNCLPNQASKVELAKSTVGQLCSFSNVKEIFQKSLTSWD